MLLAPHQALSQGEGSAEPVPLGDRWTAHSRLYDLGLSHDRGQRFVLDTGVTQLNYRGDVGTWLEIDATFMEADGGPFSMKWSKLPYLLRIDGDSNRCIYPDRNDLSVSICLDKPFQTMGASMVEGNRITWDLPNQTIIEITVLPDSVKMSTILRNPRAPTSLSIPFALDGLSLEDRLLKRGGETVATIAPAIAVDARGRQRELPLSFAGGRMSMSLDPTGMLYPITIDPTVDLTVGASSDDAKENVSTGAMNLTSARVALVSSTSATGQRAAGCVFTGGPFPSKQSRITAAFVTVDVALSSKDDANGKLRFERSASPATFSNTAFDLSQRPLTTSFTPWVEDGLGVGLTSTPSLAAPLQEVIDAFDVTTLAFIALPNNDVPRTLELTAYDSDPTVACRLHIEWTERPDVVYAYWF